MVEQEDEAEGKLLVVEAPLKEEVSRTKNK
jgi:hypothetical protein